MLREMIPQMIRIAHSRPEEVSRLKHLRQSLKLVHTMTDARGKALKRGETTLKEINLMHIVLNKMIWTSIMMQLGTRIFYGITNFQDPVGQVVYRTMDFVLDALLGADAGGDDDDDADKISWLLQDAALPLGMLYKMGIQMMTSVPTKGFGDTYFRGRIDDTADFLWRTTNTVDLALNQLGVTDIDIDPDDKSYFDVPWLIDDFLTGIKLMGWTPADNKSAEYLRRGFYYGIDKNLKPYFTVENRWKKSFGGGRYVETEHRGISGLGDGGSKIRALYLFDPLSYIPFLDRLTTGK